jgi:hypothetical protein
VGGGVGGVVHSVVVVPVPPVMMPVPPAQRKEFDLVKGVFKYEINGVWKALATAAKVAHCQAHAAERA